MFLFYNSNQQNCGSSSFAKSSGIRKSNGLLTLQSARSKSIDCITRMNFKKPEQPSKKPSYPGKFGLPLEAQAGSVWQLGD